MIAKKATQKRAIQVVARLDGASFLGSFSCEWLGYGTRILIGFWRNYNEFGVIELPNKDFWREAPYIAKDMGKHIYSTVSGQGSSRGAYEPV
jgi:hypothetical protein